jgi:hypothetical protein
VFDASIQDNSNITINMPFRFDGYPLGAENADTLDLAVKYIKNAQLYDSVMKYYKELYTSGKSPSSTAKSDPDKAGLSANIYTSNK